jgi:predicted MFS family arabinose efflux permease
MFNRSPLSVAWGGMIALAVGIGIGRFVYIPILPPMMAALGLSKSAAGLIASANFAGYLIGAIGSARTSLPGSRRLWLIGALFLSAATTFAMGFGQSLPAFLTLRLIGGLASAVVLIMASALVLDRLSSLGRPRLDALHFAGVGAGIAPSAILVAGLSGAVAGWAPMWRVSGLLSFIGTCVVALLVPAQTEAPPAAAVSTADGTADRRRLHRLILAYGLFGFGYVITATFLVAIVRVTPAIRQLEPIIWTLAGLSAAPSVALWSMLGRRWGRSMAFAVASLAEAIGVLASVFWPSPAGICVAAVLVGGTFMGLTALGLVRGRELTRGDPRRVMAAMTAAFGVGQIVGPALAGIMSDVLGGFDVPSAVAAAALLASAWLAADESPPLSLSTWRPGRIVER